MSYFHHYDEVNDLLLCSHSSTFTFGSHLKQYSKHTPPHSNILTHYLNQSKKKEKKRLRLVRKHLIQMRIGMSTYITLGILIPVIKFESVKE